MGSTTHGIPWPVGTDRLMDGDDSIRSLAEYVDTAIYNPPRGRIYLAATSGSLAANAWTSYSAGLSTAYAKGGVTVVNTAQLRVPTAGLYRVIGQVYFNAASATGGGSRRGARVTKNGDPNLNIAEAMQVGPFSGEPAVTATAINDVELAANDTLYLTFWHDQTGANLTSVGNANASYTFLSCHWIAAIT